MANSKVPMTVCRVDAKQEEMIRAKAAELDVILDGFPVGMVPTLAQIMSCVTPGEQPNWALYARTTENDGHTIWTSYKAPAPSKKKLMGGTGGAIGGRFSPVAALEQLVMFAAVQTMNMKRGSALNNIEGEPTITGNTAVVRFRNGQAFKFTVEDITEGRTLPAQLPVASQPASTLTVQPAIEPASNGKAGKADKK